MECLNLVWDDIGSEIVNEIVKNKNKLVKKWEVLNKRIKEETKD